jgi:Na+-translocating ferredoxin:NAD+ oxidoreductase subunit G
MMDYRLITSLAACAVVLAGTPATAQTTREKALAAAYPGTEIRSDRVFLTESQVRRAREISGGEVPSGLIARYVVVRDGKVIGRAYVDTHVVRTKNESLLIMLEGNGSVRRIEVTSFFEPPEYQAPRAWYDQYNGKELTGDLRLNRAIRPIAGASLTARATTEATRRVLAIDQVLRNAEGNK